MKINKSLLPIKAHFFFFFAALGPFLPQINVYGKQLGISPAVMGFITAVLPFLWALAKPAVGFIVDYFHQCRKMIFMLLIFIMSGSYICMYFLPEPPRNTYSISDNISTIIDFKQDNFTRLYKLPSECRVDYFNSNIITCLNETQLIRATCGWICSIESLKKNISDEIQPKESWKFYIPIEEQNDKKLSILYYKDSSDSILQCEDFNMINYFDGFQDTKCTYNTDCKYLSCALFDVNSTNSTSFTLTELQTDNYNLYGTITFWGFVIFTCGGTVAFNVANCIGDAVCFDVLGADNNMKYGIQRAWGTFGYGLTALISGWLVDFLSGDDDRKDFTPAFVIMAVFTLIDLYFCRKLKLPKMSRPQGAGGTLAKLMKERTIIIFLIFAVVAGIFDSFILYYMFWFLEEIAKESGKYGDIKFMEGLIIAVESFGGEILFFAISGKILKYFGYRNTLTFSLLCYAVRLYSISLITHPWHLVLVEMFLQGPTYALCYSTIVGYAAAVAPPGLSATLQGVMAGMDDGVGFAIGSLIGGIVYHTVGGRASFQLFAIAALIAAIIHAILGFTLLKNVPINSSKIDNKDENATIEEADVLMTNIDNNKKMNTTKESDLDVEKSNGNT